MKKKIVLIVVLVAMLFALCSCMVGNRRVGFDSAQTFEKADILIEGEWKRVSVKSWRDFDQSDVVQVEATDGTVYLTHYSNAVLIKEGKR